MKGSSIKHGDSIYIYNQNLFSSVSNEKELQKNKEKSKNVFKKTAGFIGSQGFTSSEVYF